MTDPAKTPYWVTCISQSNEQLKDLTAQAIRLGKYKDFLAAVKEIARRLSSDPLQWGDPLYHYRHLELMQYRGVHAPLYVLYAVDEQRKLVYVSQFRPLPGHGYTEE
ncbi:MAG TPA: hypothetical protein VH682_29265 [Gemmataceae bacterium]|jgi:hypothetical protein